MIQGRDTDWVRSNTPGYLSVFSLNTANLTLIKEYPMGTVVHQALLDPYGTHIFAPEPKRDMLHWWKINSTTSELNHTDHITFAKGVGPRHGVFWRSENNKTLGVYLFVIGETDNRVHQYEIA
jgi:6-phosphogluconolactonase (cycloisomerase 2 family)